MIAAFTKKRRVIGSCGAIPWCIPEDLARFKALTTGNAVIMGRKTFESIGKPLPERKSIVISSAWRYDNPAVVVVPSLAEALKEAQGYCVDDAFVCGGGRVYSDALPFVQKIYATEIDAEFDGDTFFPQLPSSSFCAVRREKHVSAGGIPFEYVDYVRR